jgi:hypothetical protein
MSPTTSNNALFLSPWHQKQAAMLAYYSSLDYLITLHELVTQLVEGKVEPTLDLASSQGRDAVLVNERWGARDTSQNWSNNAWPFLKNLQASLARNIAERSLGKFSMTAVHEYFRGMDQFSLGWMTPEEEVDFNAARKMISDWANPIDYTMPNWMSNDWDDYGFAWDYPVFASRFDQIPKFRIRTDIVCPTGVIPAQTGIYIAKDDPHAVLQFAWSGKDGRELRKASTFNELGLAALAAVGREDLWFSDEKMFKFTTSPAYAKLFHDDVVWADGPHPNLAPSAVARRAFTTRDVDWYLVEPIPGEFDKLVDLDAPETVKLGPRIVGGEQCVEPGFYFSPSRPDSRRHLSKNETAPTFDTQYGQTIWQWDSNQT